MLSVKKIHPRDDHAYQEYVLTRPDAMLYHSAPYLALIRHLTSADDETLLAYDTSGAIVGVFPILAKTGPLGRVLNSLPYYGSNGSLLVSSPDAKEALLQSFDQLASKKDIISATVVGNPISEHDYIRSLNYQITDTRIGQFTNIGFSSDHAVQLMNLFHSKTRNMIRKAAKNEIKVSVENDMTEFLSVTHCKNMEVIGGIAKSPEFFNALPKYFTVGSDYKIWIARLDGEPIAALLLFYFKGIVEYYTPVVCGGFRDLQPLSLLIYEAMEDASKRGYRLWNWGGTWTSQTGVYMFKKRWGTYDRTYTYYIRINNESIFSVSSEMFLRDYPNFYVVPFRLLRGSKV